MIFENFSDKPVKRATTCHLLLEHFSTFEIGIYRTVDGLRLTPQSLYAIKKFRHLFGNVPTDHVRATIRRPRIAQSPHHSVTE